MIPINHPRYHSLMIREKLVEGFEKDIVAREGLIAHGRGEAFDYLIGEKTIEPALKSINAASAHFILAKHPVISVNGNVAALCAKEISELSQSLEKLSVEVNLFYHTLSREKAITNELKKYGIKKILGIDSNRSVQIPEPESNRRKIDSEGIFIADTVFVPLEDGDRTIALKKMGKKVITVDLNPLSRTSIASDISIIDNIIRVFPMLIKNIEDHKKNSTIKDLENIINNYNNKETMKECLRIIRLGSNTT
ncbi:MAG TPA: phosphopantothenate/pantothenate synthetase [Candidatus Nitrosocosmicus sp.]